MRNTETLTTVIRQWTPPGLNEQRLRLLALYVQTLLKWNRKINLVGTQDAETVVARHVVDSVLASTHLTRQTRVVDVGSGAGLPGLVAATCRPELHVTLVERRGKKAAFLTEAARILGLTNVTIRSADASVLAGSEFFDQAISRATFAPPAWLELAQTMVTPRGTIWFMLGPRQHLDFLESQKAFRTVDRFEYELPDGGKRRLVGISRRKADGLNNGPDANR